MLASTARRRVLMTTDAVGGIWNYSLNLARALAARDTDSLILAVGPAPSHEQTSAMLSIPRLKFFHRFLPLEWMQPSDDAIALSRHWMLNFEAAFHPSIIHLNSYLYAAFPWRAPTLIVAHSCVCSWWQAVHCRPAPGDWDGYRARVTAGLRAANMVVAPSEAMLSALRSNYEWRGPATVIPNGADAPPSNLAPKSEYIAAVGRAWDAAKNLSLLETVASGLPWPIMLAGELSFQNLCFSAPNLSLLGQLDSLRLDALLQRASIYVHPAKYEPFGLSVLEAAAAGNALVLSDIASLREHWDGAALFASHDRPGEWTVILKRLIDNPDLRCEYQARARKRSGCFSESRMANAYTEIYRALAQNRALELSPVT